MNCWEIRGPTPGLRMFGANLLYALTEAHVIVGTDSDLYLAPRFSAPCFWTFRATNTKDMTQFGMAPLVFVVLFGNRGVSTPMPRPKQTDYQSQ